MHRPASAKLRTPSSVGVLHVFITILLVLAGLLSFGVRLWDVDLALARLWWHGPRVWFGDRSWLCRLLNEYGPLPGVLFAVGALVTLVAAALSRKMRHLALPALYIVLAFLLGPGLLVNGVLKHSWSRARPKDLAEFGRKQPYEKVFTHVEGSRGRSFPSGHASAAFFLSSLGFACAVWGTRRGMWVGLAVGALWGSLVAWSRIASGAHFLSDVVWSAALVNLVNFAVLMPFVARRAWMRNQWTVKPMVPVKAMPVELGS